MALGPVVQTRDWSWRNGESVVLEVADGAGLPWIVKRHHHEWAYRRELSALIDWAPAMGEGRAPRLRAWDDATQTLVMTRLPGVVGGVGTADGHRQAGQLIARLHALGPQGEIENYATTMHRQLDDWLRRVPEVLAVDEVDFVSHRIDELSSLPAPVTAPTHNDYQPRNWLLDDAGVVRVFDFGRAKIDMFLRDFERMWFAEWTDHPDLRRAFFAGYGRQLDEVSLITVRGAYQAASTILWAREHADPDFEQHGRRMLGRLRRDRT